MSKFDKLTEAYLKVVNEMGTNNAPNTLNSVGLAYVPYKNDEEAGAIPYLVDNRGYTSIIPLEHGWACETHLLKKHQSAINRFIKSEWI